MCPLSQSSIDPKKEGDLLMVNGSAVPETSPRREGSSERGGYWREREWMGQGRKEARGTKAPTQKKKKNSRFKEHGLPKCVGVPLGLLGSGAGR